MKIVFFVFTLLFICSLEASPPDFEKVQCKGVVKELFSKNVEEFGVWRSTFPDSFVYEAFRFHPYFPTNWSEVQISKKDMIVRTYDGKDLKEANIGSDCSLNFQKIDFPFELKKNEKLDTDFDDQKLIVYLKTLKKNKSALFYLWSPKFSYSVTHYPFVEKYARDLGLEFIPLLDPRVNREESLRSLNLAYSDFWKKNALKHRSLANQGSVAKTFSMDFYLRFGFSHFPISIVASNEKIHPRWITGVMTEKGFKAQVKKIIKELN